MCIIRDFCGTEGKKHRSVGKKDRKKRQRNLPERTDFSGKKKRKFPDVPKGEASHFYGIRTNPSNGKAWKG